MKYVKEFIEYIMLGGKKIGGMMIFVAYAAEYPDVDFVYVWDLEIERAYRNKGIGTNTLKELVSKYSKVYVCPSNPDSERLYRRLGQAISYDDCPEVIRNAYQECGTCFLLQ